MVNSDKTRRTIIKSAAWSLPVIAAAVASPLAAASHVVEPVSCILINGTGSPYYAVTYSNGDVVTLHRSEIVQDDKLKEMCKTPARWNEGS